ncbi:hypothetical protein V5799_033449 [Amblyomma americanum]|uniref:Endonuclease/exonuclease/phosphatase domain-containing protein n=1 Tax=Amblyomma americanum TaxID=6943 RepID=A0AAQ4DNA0_AMBAM
MLTPVLPQIGPRALVRGDLNAHNREWSCRTTSRVGRILMEAMLGAGLGLLKPPFSTFVTLRRSETLDLAFTTPGIRYKYRKPTDTCGSDHFTLFLTRTSRLPHEDRTYAVVSWTGVRALSKEILLGQSFLDHVASCAREATIMVTVPASSSVPDLRLLNLKANSRRQERIALNSSLPADWTAYRRIDAACPCKTMEAIALSHLTLIARVTNFLPEQLTGFRMVRCTADSIADLVSTMEDARHDRDAVMLVLLDVKAAFDTLPRSVIDEALSRLGVTGALLAFVPAFLQGRTFRVHVGGN